jgi:hypothetical protein
VTKEVMDKYRSIKERLWKELKDISLEDHLWNLKFEDHNGIGVVKVHCGECRRDFGSMTGVHSRTTIHNLFANFKKSHLMSTIHVQNWCHWKDVPFTDHPQSAAPKEKLMILTIANHKKLVQEGIKIMDTLNNKILCEKKPFAVIGDMESGDLKSFWFKVRCIY